VAAFGLCFLDDAGFIRGILGRLVDVLGYPLIWWLIANVMMFCNFQPIFDNTLLW